MHAYLYISSDNKERTQAIRTHLLTLEISTFDTIVLAPLTGSIGIGDIREFIRRLSLTPEVSPYVAGIIEDGSLLTLEAQQALLKSLEEPPPHAYIVIGSPTTEALLPTIVSRCLIVRMHDMVMPDVHISVDETVGEGKLLHQLAGLGKTKEDYLRVFDQMIFSLRNEVLTQSHSKKVSLLHRLLSVRQYQANNVHPLTLLEYALLDKANRIRYNNL